MINKSKIGVFPGTFDPIHIGHLEFALDAIKNQKLDAVYFLPNRQTNNKHTAHYAHRLAMIKLAIKPYPNLYVMELTDRQFSATRSMPKIKKAFPDSVLYFLVSKDKTKDPIWQKYSLLFPTNKSKDIKSTDIRLKIAKNKKPNGLLPSTKKYIKDNWLYVSISH